MRERREQWRHGLADELGFWRAWVEGRGLDWPHDFAARFDPTRELATWLRRLVEPVLASGDVVRVLDVGAGPATTLGALWPGRALELVAVDPLAESYNEVLDRFGLCPPVRTQAASAEDLPRLFGERAFHLVHCKNALDHMADPVEALRAMTRVVVPRGCVRLEHAKNEATTQHYAGLHQWNLDAVPGGDGALQLVAWREDERHDLGEAVGAEAIALDANADPAVVGWGAPPDRPWIAVQMPQTGWVRATIRTGPQATG